LIKRGRFFRTFVNTITGRKIQKLYRTPQHYRDIEGNWQEYDFTWRREGDEWVNDGGPWTARINLSDSLLVFTDLDGEKFELQLLEIGGRKVSALPVPRVEGERLIFPDVAAHTNIVFRSSAKGISVLRILKSALSPRSFKWQSIGNRDSKRTKMAIEAMGIENLRLLADRTKHDGHRRLELKTDLSSVVDLPDGRSFFEINEIWTGRASRTNADRTKEWVEDVAYPVLIDPTFGPTNIQNQANDGREYVHGTAPGWDNNLNRILIGHTALTATFAGGLRWQSISVPQGASIASATINLSADSIAGSPVIQAKGDLQTNAPVFSISDLPTGVNSVGTVTWTPTATGTADINVTGAVQAIVNQTGWSSSNAMRFALVESATGGGGRYIYIGAQAAHSEGYLANLRIVWTSAPTTTLEQEGFRWRNDDDSESAASWRQNQDVNDGLGAGAKARLRALINATGDPAAKQYQLEGRVKGVGAWRKLEPPSS
jgi:hypothetical protein